MVSAGHACTHRVAAARSRAIGPGGAALPVHVASRSDAHVEEYRYDEALPSACSGHLRGSEFCFS